jgi:hypothetical protein
MPRLLEAMTTDANSNTGRAAAIPRSRSDLWPWLAMAAVVAAAVVQLRRQGRIWWCALGDTSLWSSDVNGPHNSQHLFDPYAFTHVLHGVALCGMVAWVFPRLPTLWKFCVTIAFEALWEVFENSRFVIDRYRTATMAVGYQGDSVINSLGDILSCGIGFWLAWRLGFWRSVIFFLVTEGILLLWIRDDLLLNVVMLIYPIQAIKAWQSGG